jgi:Tfp pilus assembly protein PilV
MEKSIFTDKKAQSLIESVVAISIVVIAIIGIISVGITHVSLGGQSAERVIAINLAREGLEIVSALRNSNALDPDQSWPYGLENDSYRVGFNPAGLVQSSASPSGVTDPGDCTDCSLCQHPDEYYYYDDFCSQTTPFKRLIIIEDGDDLGGNCSGCEKKITSLVFWEERGREHNLSFEIRLTDWR